MQQKSTLQHTTFSSATILSSQKRQATSYFSYLFMALMSVSVVGMSGCSETQREQAEQTVGLDEKDVFSLQVGTCFNDTSDSTINSAVDEEISDVPVRDCNKPHDYEVYHLFDLTGDSLPSDEAFEQQVIENCDPSFEQYVGKSYEDSIYSMSTLSPTPESWETGDREVACFLFDDSGEQLTESLKGKNM